MEKTDQKVLYFYGEVTKTWKNTPVKRRAALAGVLEGNKLKIGAAVCGEKDIFNRAIARKISAGRANKKPILETEVKSTDRVSNVFADICRGLIKNNLE